MSNTNTEGGTPVTIGGTDYVLKLTTERVIAFEDITGQGIFAYMDEAGDGRRMTENGLILFYLMAGKSKAEIAAMDKGFGTDPLDLWTAVQALIKRAAQDLGLAVDASAGAEA